MVINPDFLELTERLTESEREIDHAREQCRLLLHQLTDARITIEAARRALTDFDGQMVGDVETLPALKGGA